MATDTRAMLRLKGSGVLPLANVTAKRVLRQVLGSAAHLVCACLLVWSVFLKKVLEFSVFWSSFAPVSVAGLLSTVTLIVKRILAVDGDLDRR